MRTIVTTYGWLGYFLLSILSSLLYIGVFSPSRAVCTALSAVLLVFLRDRRQGRSQTTN